MITIVVPVYNSEQTLENLCIRIMNEMNRYELKFEIVLVDDFSSDNSYKIMEQLYHKYKRIKCIKLRGNAGQQNALLCGLRHGMGEYFVTIDDDLQYDPEDIIGLYKKVIRGYDVVYGIPNNKKHSSYRNVGTRMNDFIFNYLLKKPKEVKIGSFRIMNKKTVECINLEKNKFVYLSAATFKHTKNAANIYVNHYSRTTGQSNYNLKKLLKLFLSIIIYYGNIRGLKKLAKSGPQYEIEEVLN